MEKKSSTESMVDRTREKGAGLKLKRWSFQVHAMDESPRTLSANPPPPPPYVHTHTHTHAETIETQKVYMSVSVVVSTTLALTVFRP